MLDDQKPLPESGWDCVHVEDYGEANQRCEMCKHERIRFIHVMEHCELLLTARMGRVCAAKYGADPAAPLRRERNLKNRALRRQNWLTRRWRTSAKGNDTRQVQGKHVSVFWRGRGYAYWIGWTEYKPIFENGEDTGYDEEIEHSDFSPRIYTTADAAKLALFDELWPLADCFNVTEEAEE